MSDWNTPRQTTTPLADVRDVVELFYSRGSFLPGEVVEEADALAALASLESQNQALQGALRLVNTKGHPEWCAWSCFGGVEEKVCDCWVMPARNALSPTQETDPE